MKIERVDKNCITCQISREELEQRGMQVEDLMSDHDKARDLLTEVLLEAKAAVDFSAESGTLNVQMAVMQDGAVSLTIFDDERSAISAMLRQYKELLEMKRAALQMAASQQESGAIGVGQSVAALSPEQTKALL